MAEHSASVTIHAPVQQVYALFTHFDDFPKFMHFVKEVTYYDEHRTHWVVHVLRDYEWDAVNEDWIPNQQVGWRSTAGLHNSGKVKFRPMGNDRTIVDVYIHYEPPSGPLGLLGDTLGINSYFDMILKEDLQHFARMVEQAPPGALDPMSSHYLFHPTSATAIKATTPRQNAAMEKDPRMRPEALAERKQRIEREIAELRARQQQQETERQRLLQEQKRLQEEHAQLEREIQRRLQEQRAREAAQALAERQRRKPDPVYDTLGGRNAAKERTAFGDKDGRRLRHPRYEETPMLARYPIKASGAKTVPLGEEKLESPWLYSIRGTPTRIDQEAQEQA